MSFRSKTYLFPLAGILLGSSLLGGCISIGNYSDDRTATKITNDAVRLNEAFNRSTNAVILKNILRARDRWTVNFTTLSGIRSRPTRSMSGSVKFSPLGLGNAIGPFTGSNAGVGLNSGTLNEYSVNPFSNHDNSQSLLAPMLDSAFKSYYDSGWPRDVVFLLFVRSVSIDLNGKPYTIHNAGDNYQEMKTALEHLFAYKPGAGLDLKNDFDLKRVNDKYSLVLSPAGRAKSGLQDTDKDRAALSFHLRSFEDIIYYLGEVERVAPANRPMAKSPCDGTPGPIFIVHEDKGKLVYAASVNHAGVRYAVLPQYGRYCFVERTSTTMSILNQLLLLNQSSEFLKAPNNFFQ